MNPNVSSIPASIPNKMEKAMEVSSDALRDAKENTLSMARDFTKKAESYSVVVRDWVKENPLQAALIGAGIGFAAGAIGRRAMFSSTKSRQH